MWPIYNIIATQDEGGRTLLNLHNFKMVYHETINNITFIFLNPKLTIHLGKRLELFNAQGLTS